MELILNAIWLALSVGATGLWLCVRPSGRCRLLQGVVAMSCLLVLLFPVISMSDDLRAPQMAVEDASATSKRLLQAAGGSHCVLHSERAPAPFGAGISARPRQSWENLVIADSTFTPASPFVLAAFGRAPPLSL